MAEHGRDNGARIVSRGQIHDIKNRLTVIKGMAQLLGRQVQRADWERDRIVQRVDGLQIEIGKLEEMIEGLRHTPSMDQSSTSQTTSRHPASSVPDGEASNSL